MRAHLAQAGISLALGATLLLSGCSGGSGASETGNSSGQDKLEVVAINVLAGQQWQINRPIDVTFNRDVDFSTVSFSTINIIDDQGRGATGVFSQPVGSDGQVNQKVVRFQPNCPKLEDYSDAGLVPYSTYRLTVRGSNVGGTAVTDTAGEPLEVGALIEFATPSSDEDLVLFVDTTAGPPVVVVRGLNDDPALPASSILLGGVEQEYLWSVADQAGMLTFDVPLNHYSIEENQLQILLQFNQPIRASSDNISTDLVELQYASGADPFQPMQAEIELLQNCSERGASVRLRPLGLVPQDSDLRVMLRQGFSDLIGDSTTADLANFSVMHTVSGGDANPLHPGVNNPEVDDILDTFAIGGAALGSLEDLQAVEEFPPARWGDGELKAAFDFAGTGGPGGNFDWNIPPATEIVLDTVSDLISSETGTQSVINGVVDIRNLLLPADSKIRIVGPNPCTILASGTVNIKGEISVNGSDSPGVGTLNTTNQPEQGAKGNAGGGDGGQGSFLTTQSTPRGGTGYGAFGVPSLGGQGGEASYSPGHKDERRGSGGGGGRFGPDVYHLHDGNSTTLIRAQALVGLDAEPGAPGGALGLGAVSQSERAQGGMIGPSPFIDSNADNNFLGTMIIDPDPFDGIAGTVVLGELDGIYAGTGGGGGGDAVKSDSFPLIPFKKSGDEKGSGGGGGAGGLRILAIGDITIGDAATGLAGFITAVGGDGGGGENTSYFDRVGGGSGAGSGGHVVLSTAGTIHFHGEADPGNNPDFWYRDNIGNAFHSARPISLVGGQGGAGNQSSGGANQNGPSTWRCDSVPNFFDEGLTGTVPPFKPQGTFVCFHAQPDKGDDSGFWTVGAGGDGGPGMVQLHVDDPDVNLVFHDLPGSYMAGMDVSLYFAPPPLGWSNPTDSPNRMVPFFGSESESQSKWIPLGLARLNPGGSEDSVFFDFRGTDPATGVIPGDGNSSTSLLPPVLGPLVVGSPSYTMTLSAAGLAQGDELYTENPRLFKGFTVRLEDAGDPSVSEQFVIVDATYDGVGDTFTVHLDPNGPNPSQFQAASGVNAFVVPHFVRVITNGVADSYPDATEVSVEFDAATINPATGQVTNIHGFTTDISDLYPPANLTQWDLFRFKVHFNIDKDGGDIDITTPKPSLDHLRVHFTF